MIKNIIKALIIISIGLIQILLMPYLAVYGVWPNLVLILAIMLLFFNADAEAFFSASLGGLILDLASPLPFGLITFIAFSLLLLIKILIIKFFNDLNIFIFVLVMAGALIIFDLIFMVIGRNFSLFLLIINISYGLILSLIFYKLIGFYMDHNQGLRIKL